MYDMNETRQTRRAFRNYTTRFNSSGRFRDAILFKVHVDTVIISSRSVHLAPFSNQLDARCENILVCFSNTESRSMDVAIENYRNFDVQQCHNIVHCEESPLASPANRGKQIHLQNWLDCAASVFVRRLLIDAEQTNLDVNNLLQMTDGSTHVKLFFTTSPIHQTLIVTMKCSQSKIK